MRHIILVLIALVALGGLLPAVNAAPAKPVLLDNPAAMAEPAQTALLTTPSMAAFLNDSWQPSTFVAPVITNENARKNVSVNNSTYAIYDFLNGTNSASAATSPIYIATAAGKDKTVAWTGESIYQFLDPSWTPSKSLEIVRTGAYKMHEMS
jgi:hypothetical protein